MYLSDLIRKDISQKLQETCVGHAVTFTDIDIGDERTIFCTHAKFGDDDGNCWIEFTDDKGQKFITDGQGIDVWFEINDN